MKSLKIGLAMLLFALVWMAGGTEDAEAVKGDNELIAAFVRNGDLWIKRNNQEKKLAGGPFIRNPRWSFDGKWLAYTKGEFEKELWVLELSTARSSLVHPEGGSRFQWSPSEEKLAYQMNGQLQYVDARSPNKPLGTADGIGNYSWLPSGDGFFASSQSELLPDGWTPIILYRIPIKALGDISQYITVHVLPKQSDDFFAVGTSVFKWSADGRWIAFLATPTASLSADSNTLCVVSADGVVFRTLDEMVNNAQWFEWADRGDHLAYIAGVGREATRNKQLRVLAVTTEKAAEYTPKDFVDQAFAWQGLAHMVVSRAVESKEGSGLSEAAYPYLVRVELENGRQKLITKPSKKHGAYNPIALHSMLAWVKYNGAEADVMLADENGRHAGEWIKRLDIADSYYGQWNWPAVLSFYCSK
ncbi:hypothetical protein [Paenibacillus sp. LHD-38]|uniref:hypothetical protein n=1 Tax=Paenibacillus sp. LHD-38 TaxID=3072143 RepID=UPI00280D8CCA|nr:hypothetical protein [Paenibacillus sp. LHD-38]MDQ8738221.1 hypothetical protein [Paenibacillus sp. LHD-38]